LDVDAQGIRDHVGVAPSGALAGLALLATSSAVGRRVKVSIMDRWKRSHEEEMKCGCLG
jgi:hypothetical protein